MTDRRNIDGEGAANGRLDAFLDAARAHPPAPSEAFLARVAADAAMVDAARARSALATGQAAATVAAPAPRRGLQDILRAIGGWPALAGLATATVAGLWIGYAAPDLGGLALVADSAAAEGVYDLGGLLPEYVPTDDWSG